MFTVTKLLNRQKGVMQVKYKLNDIVAMYTLQERYAGLTPHYSLTLLKNDFFLCLYNLIFDIHKQFFKDMFENVYIKVFTIFISFIRLRFDMEIGKSCKIWMNIRLTIVL